MREGDTSSLFSIDKLSKVEEIRKQLSRMDFMLADISNIIHAYMEHQVSTPQVAPPPIMPESQEAALTNPSPTNSSLFSDLSEINEKLTEANSVVDNAVAT